MYLRIEVFHNLESGPNVGELRSAGSVVLDDLDLFTGRQELFNALMIPSLQKIYEIVNSVRKEHKHGTNEQH